MRVLIKFLIFLILSSPAWATTYYVRDGGGSVYGTSQATNTCNGTVNVIYSFGASPNCAVNHPAWILGTNGYNGNPNTQILQSGDTMNIDGDSDTSPGTQAQYMTGYGMPNTSGICNNAGKYNCYMQTIPAGTLGHQTSIIGTGTHKPQLWSTQNSYEVLNASNNYLTLQWLELTDHVACAYNDPTGGCPTLDGNPQYDGMRLSGDGIVMTDVYVHGFARYGIYGAGFGSATFTRLYVIGNGQGGFMVGQDGNEQVTGTLTFNQPIVEWNGCVEAYPITNIDDPNNYTNCFGQSNSGYGDGLAFGASASQLAGNWTIIGPGSMSWNTQDGLDILHGNAGVGTDNIDKMRFEGNGGQQLKLTAQFDNVTNNLIIGNCGWWYTAPQTLSGGMGPGDSCRAANTTIRFTVTASSVANFINNTIMNTGIAFESSGSGTCNSNTKININNNIVGGGPQWNDNSGFISGGGDKTSTNFYADGFLSDYAFNATGVTTWPAVGDTYTNNGLTYSVLYAPISGTSGIIYTSHPGDPLPTNHGSSTLTRATGSGDSTISYSSWFDDSSNGTGSCGLPGNGTGGIAGVTEDYNLFYGMKNSNFPCSGAHDKCNASPGFTAGTFLLGTAFGSLSSYYQGHAGVTLLPISSGSVANGAGLTGLSYWNNGNDYHNVTRPTNPSMGGLEVNSCAVNSFDPCFFSSDCCGGACTNNVCATAILPTTQSMITGQVVIYGKTYY